MIRERLLHAGQVPYESWRKSGIEIIAFDKDGTLGGIDDPQIHPEVLDALHNQQLAVHFPRVAIISNNPKTEHIKTYAETFKAALGLDEVLAVSPNQELKRKPHPAMGQYVAGHFQVDPSAIGIVGDRYFTDVLMARRMGAGAVALCDKIGEGDGKWVPALRYIEAGIIALESFLGLVKTGGK